MNYLLVVQVFVRIPLLACLGQFLAIINNRYSDWVTQWVHSPNLTISPSADFTAFSSKFENTSICSGV